MSPFWKLKKILVFHRQPYYRYSYHISEMLRYQKKRRNCEFFFSTWSFVSNFVCFREIFAGFDIEKSYNYIQHVIQLCQLLITRFCRIIITYSQTFNSRDLIVNSPLQQLHVSFQSRYGNLMLVQRERILPDKTLSILIAYLLDNVFILQG